MSITESIDDRFSSQYVDLLSEQVGGKALSCSDEWFAECANLVKPGRGVFKEGCFVSTGQWMDGWESRRSFGRKQLRPLNGIDHDWCILRLGIPGVIHGVDIDTNHFKGNAPEFVSVEAALVDDDINEYTVWHEILVKSPSIAHSQNLFVIDDSRVFSHVRLNMFPDGGIARFRVYGKAHFNKKNYITGELIDLASVVNGGRAIECSNRFYSSPNNLLVPKNAINMGDGWETKRRRNQDHDWSIIKLGVIGSIRKIIIDTAHFKGNFPDRFSLEATLTDRVDITATDILWQTVVDETTLYADREHIFIDAINVLESDRFSHVRLNIYPDGGVSRLRVLGFIL